MEQKKMQTEPAIDGCTASAAVLEGVVRALVRYPDQVNVQVLADENAGLLKLHVCESDLERVLGERRRTVRSLQTMLSALGKKGGKHLTLEISSDNS